MIKNTGSQKIGCQMVTAADGSEFTSSVTVYVTGDAGTQAAGSVGSGACTHEGHGYHTYAPAQAETNYDLVAFTFTGTGAVPETVQIFTGAATPSVNATQFAGQTITAAAGVTLPSSVASPTNITAGTITTATNVTNVSAGGIVAASFAADAITAAKIAADVTTELQSGLATAANLSTAQTAITAIKAKTDSLTFTQTGHVDANIQRINDVTITGDGSATPFNV